VLSPKDQRNDLFESITLGCNLFSRLFSHRVCSGHSSVALGEDPDFSYLSIDFVKSYLIGDLLAYRPRLGDFD